MAGYIGSKSSVTQVDGYSEAEADAEFVAKSTTGNLTLDVSGILNLDSAFSSGTTGGIIRLKDAGTQFGDLYEDSGNFIIASAQVDKDIIFKGNDGGAIITPMTIDMSAGGNVGIGTSSPSSSYKVTIDGDASMIRMNHTGAGGNGTLDLGVNSTIATIIANYSTTPIDLRFLTGAQERMRLDSSGNLLVGKTTDAFGTAGVVMRQLGIINITRANGSVLNLNRTGNDGALAEFHKDSTTVGSVGVKTRLYMAGSEMGIYFGASSIAPVNSLGTLKDNQFDIGDASYRWDDIRATNGTIQTSDFNEKQDIASLTATEMLVGKRISALFKTFRWKDKVVEKGENARTHTGVIAQDVQAAFTAEGLDAGDYALFISDTWWETQTEVPAVEAVAEVLDEDGNVTTEAVEAVDAYTDTDVYKTEAEAPEGATERTRLGIRYPELLSFVAAYNEQRFASIEARLTALEA